jgi:hypothetical protein
MSRQILSAVGVSLLFGASSLGLVGESMAQVWVGGGGVRVRAPFVRVDVGPYGGVSVRAPFTAIDVPGRAYYYEPYPYVIEERVIERSYPTAAEFAAMNEEQLYEQLVSIAASLQRRLGRFDTGTTWQRYFRFPHEEFASADPVVRREALIKLLDRFEKVAADQQYSMIWQLPAFVAMDAALTEAVSRPDEGTGSAPSEAEELPLPRQEQTLPPPEKPLPPQETTPPRSSATFQPPIPPQRNGPFLRPK